MGNGKLLENISTMNWDQSSVIQGMWWETQTYLHPSYEAPKLSFSKAINVLAECDGLTCIHALLKT